MSWRGLPVRHKRKGRVLGIALIYGDAENLRAEVAMEREAA
jgi:hypothetical protein